MHIIQLPKKKKGEFRTVYVPGHEEMAVLRSIAGQLSKKAERFCPDGVAHGFMRNRSPVSNALAHVGHAYTTCMDLQDFFDSVTLQQLHGKLRKEELELVLADGAARQGLPTSPAVANIAASDMDKAILKWQEKHELQFVYLQCRRLTELKEGVATTTNPSSEAFEEEP